MADNNDELQKFLNEAAHAIKEAQHIADAVPNVKLQDIECAVRQLYGIRHVLQSVANPHLPPKSENNGIEKEMIEHWGEQIFQDMEADSSLDMKNIVHQACLYLVYQSQIQASLDHTRSAWNLHKICTAGNKTPTALFELSKMKAHNSGYWYSDLGDTPTDANDPEYGVDPEACTPPTNELTEDLIQLNRQEDIPHRGASMETDKELAKAAELLKDIDLQAPDTDWGTSTYREAVCRLML
ncbi:hypothetical protein K439DRAFT_1336532 [Ramaria rubella]|nr:hypothetical protein K439DRAFT_1336532 [Ramaria rubella]